jgi:secreted trypsin-like serine protease
MTGYPEALREVTLYVWNKTQCADVAINYSQMMTPRMMCAAAPGRDTCYGDSGRPLFVMKNDKAVITGITSFGLPSTHGYGLCAQEGEPVCVFASYEPIIWQGFYTDISSVRLWVEEEIELNG